MCARVNLDDRLEYVMPQATGQTGNQNRQAFNTVTISIYTKKRELRQAYIAERHETLFVRCAPDNDRNALIKGLPKSKAAAETQCTINLSDAVVMSNASNAPVFGDPRPIRKVVIECQQVYLK